MDFDWILKGYFLFEKQIFLILLFIICLTLITIKKKGIFKKIIKSPLIISISRVGFTMVCLSYILSNFCFCGFLLKIKFNTPTFILISLGNFIFTFAICLLINIVIELPIRIVIKKVLRWNDKNRVNLQEIKKNTNIENYEYSQI